jgi:hypothetical protein
LLRFGENASSLASEVVKKGFISAERREESTVVTVCPRTMAPAAVASLLYWLSDDPPEQVGLTVLDDTVRHEVYSSYEQVVDRLHRLIEAREDQDQPLFEARALAAGAAAPEGSPFRWLLRSWEESNKRLPFQLIKEVDRRFEGRFWVFRPGNESGELVIERAGTGARIPDDEWDAFRRGKRLTDIPDAAYGRWASEAYLSVLRTGRPNISDVSAKIYWRRAGRLLYTYRRMILPCLDPDGEPLLLGASVAAVRLQTLTASLGCLPVLDSYIQLL